MSKEYSEERDDKTENQEKTEEGLWDISVIVDDAFKGLRRYWILLLVMASLCASLFYFRAKSTYVPKYNASMTFIVNTTLAVNYNAEYYNKATASQIAKTFPYIISNTALQHIIADDLGVSEIPGTIDAKAMEDTNLITISVIANEGNMAYDILQSVIRNYQQVAKAVIGETELNVVDETGIPTEPVNSDSARSAAKKGFLIGLAIDAVILLLYAMTRKTIRREEDLKKLLNVKCLGAIPRVKLKKRSDREKNRVMIDNRGVSYGFIEATRTVRTRIERDAAETGARVYMVSSAVTGEGKSTVASNLALSLAGKGKKVLLIDLDLRNPSVTEVLGIKDVKKGLIDVLTDKAYLMEVITDYGQSGLKVLPGGEPVRTTARILSNQRIELLFESLRRAADYIIVDTPPSGLLMDAAQIVKWVDAGIFVVRQDYAPVERILDGIEMLSDTGLRLAGCVMNYTEAGITGYGYGYSYGRYGYGKYGKYGTSKYTEKTQGGTNH